MLRPVSSRPYKASRPTGGRHSAVDVRPSTMSARLTLVLLALLAVAAGEMKELEEGDCFYEGGVFKDGEVFTIYKPCSEATCNNGTIFAKPCGTETCPPGTTPERKKGNPDGKYPECCDTIDECLSVTEATPIS